MKTLLSQFCSEFGAATQPLVAPLRSFCEVLQAAQESGVLGAEATPYVAGFHDVSHQLGVLAEKVAQQQAYVLIFGPLKSGKSTLMNSIAASYVSEVTALPAYPCMVYVSHAAQREFLVTRYNGDTQIFTSPASMRMQVGRDHAELAERIRTVEQNGRDGLRDFDPALHFPQAIRRIDVRVPAEALAESGAVLVDTPGLYSRMKFGYDRMTREFRNTAACAIFVVKTDNLFLEQVFQEFTQLLELFSRIFLVVNIDSTKMDLRPDGSLAPSLEREDPVRIVEAFETLSMSAALKRAVEDGRLVIHPVDLLRAAAQRLAPANGNEGRGRANDFQNFLTDLTDYLNSTDYLVAFLGDSLRHGTALIEEARGLCRHRELERLSDSAERLKRERERLLEDLAAIEGLAAIDWAAAFDSLSTRLTSETEVEAAELRLNCQKGLRTAIDAWQASDDSLKTLLDEELVPILVGYQHELGNTVVDRLQTAVQSATGGALLPEKAARALDRQGLPLAGFAADGLLAVAPRSHVEKITLRVDVDALPVRKTFVDWILFRSRSSIRRRVFGNAAHPANPIPRASKQRRLSDETLDQIEDEVLSRVDGFFEKARKRIVERSCEDYRNSVSAALARVLEMRRAQHQKELTRVATQLGRLEDVAEGRKNTEARLESAARELAALTETYGRTDPADLTTEVEAEVLGVSELQPQPRPSPPAREEADEVEIELENEARDQY